MYLVVTVLTMSECVLFDLFVFFKQKTAYEI